MNKDAIKGQLNQIVNKVKEEWTKLSENDFERVKSSYREVKEKLQKKYEDRKEEPEKKMNASSEKKSENHKK